MRTFSVILAGAALAMAAPALAAFSVGVGDVYGVPSNNNFQSNLNGAGLYLYTGSGASVTLSQASSLSFEFLGSESGFSDSFSAGGGAIFVSENSSFTGWGAISLGTLNYGPGAIADWLFSSNNGAKNKVIGTPEFGIFLPRGFAKGSTYSSNILYLGFDDQITGDDDNHDDLIIRVTATATPVDPTGGIPEPSSWAMLIAGFGLVGAARRRRRAVLAA